MSAFWPEMNQPTDEYRSSTGLIPMHRHRLLLLRVRINAKLSVEVTRIVIWQGIESS